MKKESCSIHPRSSNQSTECRSNEVPFSAENYHSSSIFPRALLHPLITYTSMVSFRMNRELHRAGAGSGTLRDRRPPRSGRGASSFSHLCVKSFSSDFPAFSKKLSTLTPFFSSMPSHSFTPFFTLSEIIPLTATHTKNASGWPLSSPANRNYSSIQKFSPARSQEPVNSALNPSAFSHSCRNRVIPLSLLPKPKARATE
jgi:hypothetical protein